MKNHARKLTAALLAFAMMVSSITPTALAAPGNASDSKGSSEEVSLSSTAETNLAAAKIIGTLGESGEDAENSGEESKAKSAVRDAIFNHYNDTADLSGYNISSKEMKSATKEVLEETNMTSLVDVTYKTDSNGNVTTADVEMDAMVALAAEELSDSKVYDLTEEQTQELLGTYAQYIQLLEANADIFGTQVSFNTTKDTNANPIGSLLDIASISLDDAKGDYATLSGMVQLYCMATQAAAAEYGDEIRAARNDALKSINNNMSTIQKYLALNDWLANYCQFAMGTIMENMQAPEPKENPLYTYAYNFMYETIKQQVYQGVYNAMKPYIDAGYMKEDEVKAQASAQADSYMTTIPEDGSGSGAQQAATTASTIVGLWNSNNVGVFIGKDAVCLGYANAYDYLVQCAFPDVYLKSGKTDLDKAENWKTYEELNYVLDSDGNPVKDSDGNYKWDATKTAGIVDQVKIVYDADVTMFGEEQPDFDSSHYWNAVRVDGKWYYVDPCYTDIYVECMIRTRVETNGNMNHLYFMFSDDSARELYDGNFKEINTLYKGIATDKTYESAWFAYAKSPVYYNNGKWYYFYDSTDVLSMRGEFGGFSSRSAISSSNAVAAADNGYGDMADMFGDTEYKIVCHDASLADSDSTYTTLVDITGGQVYNPETKAMEDNALLADIYKDFTDYAQEYPSIAVSAAYYSGKVYFNMADCILSYDIKTGALTKLIEYTNVSGTRDMSKALGGLGFTRTSDSSKADITVENPPIADMTIKDDGKMYVDIATNYGFISGKAFGDLYDYSSYGYKFAETNYNPAYNSYYSSSDEVNDNDEFMWSANIVDTIDMSHLTGSSHSYSTVNVAESCTEDAFSAQVCTTCGLIKDGTSTKVEGSAKTAKEGESGEPADGEDTNKPDEEEAPEKVDTTLEINLMDGENLVGKTQLSANGTKGEVVAEFTSDKVIKQARSYVADKENNLTDYTVKDQELAMPEVKYGDNGRVVNVALTKEASTTFNVTFEEGEDGVAVEVGKDVVSVTGTAGDPITGSALEIRIKEKVPNGYELDGEIPDPENVVYGAEGAVAITVKVKKIEDTSERAEARLNILLVDTDGQAIISTEDDVKLTENGIVNESATFTKAAIIDAAKKALSEKVPNGSENYIIDEASVNENGVTVKYGGVDSVKVTANRVQANATLTIKGVDKDGNVLKNGDTEVATTLSKNSDKGEDCAFTAEEIEEKVKELALPAGYVLASDTKYEEVTVKYGESDTITVTATEQAIATLNITVYDSADDQSDENTKPLCDTITMKSEEGVKGQEYIFTADDIKKEVEGRIGDYTLDKVEDTKAVYGGEAVSITLTATENVYGHGHTYVKFNETYYTKTNSGKFNSGVCYVCKDCGKTLEADELEENMRKTDQNGDAYDTLYDLSKLSGTLTDVWTWSTDGTKAALYQIPQELKNCMMDCVWENTNVKSTRTAATVSKSGNCKNGITYTASADGKSDKKTVKYDGHTYSKFEWTWAEDYSKATLVLTCDVCEQKETIDAQINKQETKATCDADGSVTYTAVATDSNKQAYSSTKQVTTDKALGHKYGDPAWEWEKDENGVVTGKSATATFTCANDPSHVQKVTAEITSATGDATCTEAGTITYTAKAAFNGKDYTDSQVVKGQALGHDYGEPVFTWTEKEDGGYTAKATFTCKRKGCDDKQEGHVQNVDCTVTETTDNEGKPVYTATCKFQGQDYSETKTSGSTITLSDKTAVYTGKAVAYTAEDATVTGSKGAVTYEYYLDADLTKPTTKENSGAAAEKAAPVKTGIYYVRGTVAADNNYQAATSEKVKLTINPNAVKGIKVKNASTGVKISWEKVEEAEGYRLYRKTADSGWERVTTIKDVSKVSITDLATKKKSDGSKYTSLNSGTEYIYTVRALSSARGTVLSGYDSKGVTIEYLSQPTPKVKNASTGVTISWNKVTGADGYYVYRKTSDTKWSRIADIKKNSTVSYTDKKAKSGTKYIYTVKAYSGNYVGQYHSGVTIKYLAQPTVKLSNASSGVTVKWNKITGASGYYVYRKTSGTKWSRIANIKKNSTVSYTDKKAKSGTEYIYTVKAYSGDYVGQYHSGVTIKCLAQPTVKLSNASSGITVKWSKVTGASGYYVYRKAGSEKNWTKVATIKKNGTVSWTDKNVKNGTKYIYTVKAYSGSYKGNYHKGKTLYRLTAPKISSLKNSSSKKMTVKWNTNSKASGYQIQYATNSSFDSAKSVTVSSAKTVSKTISSLTKGKTYYVRVRAYKKVSDTKYYGVWSAKKSVKISK